MGLDGHPVLLAGKVWTDVMTYCPNEWLSSYTYEGLLARLQQENPSSSGAGPEAGPAEVASALNVIAALNITKKSGAFQFVSRVSHVRLSTVPAVSKAVLEALDSAGHIVFTINVDLKLDTDIPEGQDQTALVSAVIPDREGIASLVLKLDGYEVARTSVDSQERAGKMGSLSAKQLTPINSAEFAGLIADQGNPEIENGLLIRWNDSTTSTGYTIQVGSVGGPLETLAVAVKRKYYVIKRRVLDGYRDRDMRVVVSANNLSRSQVLVKVVHVGK
jgi:hypothetical protein